LKFVPAQLSGAFTVGIEAVKDERGFFARTFCEEEFRSHGLDPRVAQTGISFNRRKGTVRGMHYRTAPFAEAKLVRCTRGAIYDVILDLRPGSPTFARWSAVELTPANGRMLYVPEGVAQGFQTLVDETEVSYQMSLRHVPEAEAGVRWDDPAFGIEWPLEVEVISARDRGWADFVMPGAAR
jgi:dTDP-4-dehydrorhamnose 3,5-epimerase